MYIFRVGEPVLVSKGANFPATLGVVRARQESTEGNLIYQIELSDSRYTDWYPFGAVYPAAQSTPSPSSFSSSSASSNSTLGSISPPYGGSVTAGRTYYAGELVFANWYNARNAVSVWRQATVLRVFSTTTYELRLEQTSQFPPDIQVFQTSHMTNFNQERAIELGHLGYHVAY